MAIMADFARMPNQRKVMVFVVIGVLAGLLYYQFVFTKLRAEVEDAQNAHDQQVANSHKLDADIKDYADLQPTVHRLKAQIDQNEKALPTESELPAFFETLNRKVTESGVQVNRTTQKPEEPVDAFIKVPVEFEIQGTFMQIKRFFASLVPHKRKAGETSPDGESAVEEHERIVSIDDLALSDPQIKNREIVLTAKFTATTYRQEERVEPAKPAPTAAPAPSGAGTGSAAPAKLPPAATPAGAKARANDAMDKDEKRSDGSAARLKGGL